MQQVTIVTRSPLVLPPRRHFPNTRMVSSPSLVLSSRSLWCMPPCIEDGQSGAKDARKAIKPSQKEA